MNKKIFNDMVLLNEQTWERLSSITIHFTAGIH